MNSEKSEFGTGFYNSNSTLFKSLTAKEVEEFRASARENYVVGTEINELHHPVYQFECVQMNAEAKSRTVNIWKEKAS